jgi:hypothetical protein
MVTLGNQKFTVVYDRWPLTTGYFNERRTRPKKKHAHTHTHKYGFGKSSKVPKYHVLSKYPQPLWIYLRLDSERTSVYMYERTYLQRPFYYVVRNPNTITCYRGPDEETGFTRQIVVNGSKHYFFFCKCFIAAHYFYTQFLSTF